MILERSSLEKSILDFARPRGPDLFERSSALHKWIEVRRSEKTWPFGRTLNSYPKAHASIAYESGQLGSGINFASQDYLSLSSHEKIKDIGRRAIDKYGLHSAGSAVLLGNTSPSRILEASLAEAFQQKHAVLYPTGWGAGYGAITALVRPYDHIVMDELSHACLHAGAAAATRNIVTTPHLNIAAMIDAVRKIREEDAVNGILVVTEALFSMDSDTPEMGPLQAACHEYGATLMVDVAHDFGALGPGGMGHIGIQQMLGKIDLVMGAFSKTFASNGGFVVCDSPAVRDQLKIFGGPHTFSNALSPVQASVVQGALDIVRGDEGEERRSNLMRNVNALRTRFSQRGIQCLGDPSAIVPVPIGVEAVARVASWLLFQREVLVNLVEFPAVRVGAARFRMQVMADHDAADMAPAADIVMDCLAEAAELVQNQFPDLMEKKR